MPNTIEQTSNTFLSALEHQLASSNKKILLDRTEIYIKKNGKMGASITHFPNEAEKSQTREFIEKSLSELGISQERINSILVYESKVTIKNLKEAIKEARDHIQSSKIAALEMDQELTKFGVSYNKIVSVIGPRGNYKVITPSVMKEYKELINELVNNPKSVKNYNKMTNEINEYLAEEQLISPFKNQEKPRYEYGRNPKAPMQNVNLEKMDELDSRQILAVGKWQNLGKGNCDDIEEESMETKGIHLNSIKEDSSKHSNKKAIKYIVDSSNTVLRMDQELTKFGLDYADIVSIIGPRDSYNELTPSVYKEYEKAIIELAGYPIAVKNYNEMTSKINEFLAENQMVSPFELNDNSSEAYEYGRDPERKPCQNVNVNVEVSGSDNVRRSLAAGKWEYLGKKEDVKTLPNEKKPNYILNSMGSDDILDQSSTDETKEEILPYNETKGEEPNILTRDNLSNLDIDIEESSVSENSETLDSPNASDQNRRPKSIPELTENDNANLQDHSKKISTDRNVRITRRHTENTSKIHTQHIKDKKDSNSRNTPITRTYADKVYHKSEELNKRITKCLENYDDINCSNDAITRHNFINDCDNLLDIFIVKKGCGSMLDLSDLDKGFRKALINIRDNALDDLDLSTTDKKRILRVCDYFEVSDKHFSLTEDEQKWALETIFGEDFVGRLSIREAYLDILEDPTKRDGYRYINFGIFGKVMNQTIDSLYR